MYSSLSNLSDNIGPDSIGYYSESTDKTVSVIKVEAAPKFYKAAGVVASFASLLRSIGYTGMLPSALRLKCKHG